MRKVSTLFMAALVISLFICGAASAAYIDYDGGVDPGSAYKMRFPHYRYGIEVKLGEHLLDFESSEGEAKGIYRNVASYCIEDQDALKSPLEYTTRTVDASSDARDKRAAWIYKEYGSFFNNGVSDKQKKYNQAAIWNVFMDDDYSLSSGDVKVLESGLSGYKLKKGGNNVLGALYDFETANGFDNYDFSGVLIASNPFSQDFITADLWLPPSEVPVPGAAWLLGTGMLGLLGLRLRRKQ